MLRLDGQINPRRDFLVAIHEPPIPSMCIFLPFDGWHVPDSRSVIAEAYSVLWRRSIARDGRTDDQHDADSIASWMRNADLDGKFG
jgi:hypothetical protein